MTETSSDSTVSSGLARDRLLVAVVAVVGLFLSVVGMQLAWNYRESILRRQLSEAAREIESNLARQAGAVEAFVETVASFVESSEAVKRNEFESFVGRTAGRWPGLVAVEWQAWVPSGQRDAFEAQLRAEGLDDFRIVERGGDGRLVPAVSRELHLPIVHVFTTGGMAPQVGLDLAASGEWLETKFKTLDVPRALASPPFGILSADGRRIGEGFSVSGSVARGGSGPVRERMRGFVSAVFAYKPMIEAAIVGTRIEQIRVTLQDEEEKVPIYFSWAADDERAPWSVDGLFVESRIDVAGRTWLLTAAPTRALFSNVILNLPWYILGIGMVITLSGVLVLSWRQRVRVERDARGTERIAVEKRFHDIVDRMAGSVLLMRGNPDGTRFEIVDINDAAGLLVGGQRESVVGCDFAAALPAAGRSGMLTALQRAWRSGGVQRIDSADITQGGRVHHLNCAFFRVGRADEICAVMQDLTDLKVAEGALREARDELELALDVSRVGLWSWDMEHKRLRLDGRCASLYGVEGASTVEDAIVTARIHPDDLRMIREEVARALAAFCSYEVEYRFTLPDGTLRHLCSRARPVREAGSTVPKIVGCSWDVTERRRMEEHLRRSQRIESLGTLAGGVAHDLNNALAPVTMGLDLLKRRLAADPDGVESVKLMQTSVRRASSIVRQLIAFKRGAGESRQPQAPAHPRRILEMLGTTLMESFPKEISVVIEPASLELPRVVADEREAHQILLNLCVNARDAMPQGGRLVITCDDLEVDAAMKADYPDLRQGSYVVFRVSDTGKGIPSEVRHRVFDPFFTTKEIGKGSGLGLSTALGIVKAHRGSIQFETKDGVGTTFVVTIPTVPDEEPEKTVPATAGVSSPVSAERAIAPCLLLVDDEQQVRELARRALEQSGFKVRTASNGREAVDVFTAHAREIDAVIMDLLMPVMNGAVATAAIKRIRPDVPIVGASGFATDALVDQARNAGITTFLPKPFTVAALVDAVREAMAANLTKG